MLEDTRTPASTSQSHHSWWLVEVSAGGRLLPTPERVEKWGREEGMNDGTVVLLSNQRGNRDGDRDGDQRASAVRAELLVPRESGYK